MKITKRQLRRMIHEQAGANIYPAGHNLEEQFVNAIEKAIARGATRTNIEQAYNRAWDYVEETLTHTPGY